MGKRQPERRKHQRFVVGARTKGRIRAGDEVSLVNISFGGAMVEHAGAAQPGTMSSLDLELQNRTLSLRCRVVWSMVVRQEPDLDGEEVTIYRTGLEFLDALEENRQVICDYIESVIEEREIIPPTREEEA
ncbi:MAG: PilZ domain-containing protein [Candidatus Methylomirabilales bacterium]